MKKERVVENINNLSDMFLKLLLHQITAIYEDYDFVDSDEFYQNSKEAFKEVINNNIEAIDLNSMIFQLFSKEKSHYGFGYDNSYSELKWKLEELFIDIGRDIAVESRLIRDNWLQQQLFIYKDNINNLTKEVTNLQKEKAVLEEDLDKANKEKLKFIEKSKTLELDNNRLDNEIITKDKKIVSLQNALEIESNKLKEQLRMISTLENRIVQLDNEIKFKKSSVDPKEVEHYKKGIEILRKENKQLKNSINDLKNETEKQRENYDALTRRNNELLSTNDEIKQETIRLNKEVEALKKENSKLISENHDMSKKISNFKKDKSKLEKEITSKNNELERFTKLDMSQIKERHSKIHNEIIKSFRPLIIETKSLEGVNIKETASKILKMFSSIKTIDDRAEIKEQLLKVIEELIKINKLFIRNNLDSGLKTLIEDFKNLDEQI